jgi:hypothetical protein
MRGVWEEEGGGVLCAHCVVGGGRVLRTGSMTHSVALQPSHFPTRKSIRHFCEHGGGDGGEGGGGAGGGGNGSGGGGLGCGGGGGGGLGALRGGGGGGGGGHDSEGGPISQRSQRGPPSSVVKQYA